MPSVWVNLTDADREAIAKAVPRLAKKMTHTKIKVASAKGKGRYLQHWVCEQISRMIGIPWSQDDDSLIRSREMGQHGIDVILRGEASTKFPYSVECKSSESLSLVDAVTQAAVNQKTGTRWLIVHKRKALSCPIVIMDWASFEELYRKGK